MKARHLLITLLLCVFGNTTALAITIHTSSDTQALSVGWYPWHPYEYLAEENNENSLTGLDVQLTGAVAKLAEKNLTFKEIQWQDSLYALEAGTLDIVPGAAFDEGRAQYAYFSIPYRIEEDVFFIRREDAKEFASVGTQSENLVNLLKTRHLRLGVMSGFVYTDPLINQFLADPANAPQISAAPNDLENLRKLINHEIDIFVADRIAGATVIWHSENGPDVAQLEINIKTPIYFMLSKKTVLPETVAAFNRAIEEVHRNGEYQSIVSWYIYPILLLQTIDSIWFKLIETSGIVAFALSGLIIAYRDKYTLLGAFILAFLPSIAGGLFRDIIFHRNPVGALQSPLYLGTVIVTVLLGHFALQINKSLKHPIYINPTHMNWILTSTEALGLASFTVLGVVISLLAKVQPLWLWGPFFSFVTTAGGTIARDLLSKSQVIAELGRDIYREITIIWGFFLSLALTFYTPENIHPEAMFLLVMITVIGAFLTRMLVYYFNVPNPHFR